MNEPAPVRIREIQELTDRALDLLDRAVGMAARLPRPRRDLVREALMPPRNHLRSSATSLRQKIEAEEALAAARRLGPG